MPPPTLLTSSCRSLAIPPQAVSRKCFIGQAVWLQTHAILRIALGAPTTRRWAQGGIEQCLEEDRYILRKWSIIAKYYKELTC